MKRICVFCGASPGARIEYLRAARELGHLLVDRGIGLVFGGGKVGMMGEIATAVVEREGRITGVIPRDLFEKEVGYEELDDLRVVNSMHERKALMVELSDGFIALPGGLGTAEEFFEVLTWAQLGLHRKPIGLLDVCGYYDRLVEFVDHAVEEHFIEAAFRSILLVDRDMEELLRKFGTYQPPKVDKAEWALRLIKN
ncbi:TIGR00730 family Rossman fold protein [Acidobacteriota bacterium]